MLTVDYDRLGLRPGEVVLDLGCGLGRHAHEALRRGASVVACDLGLAELEQVQAVVAAMEAAGELPAEVALVAVRGDAARLPFADASVDRAMASEVLEHVDDHEAAFAELARVLRPGGTLAVTVPAWLSERVCWSLSSDYHAPAAPGGHVRIYTEPELRQRLRAAGLRPGGAHLVHGLHTPYWWLRCAVGPNRPIDEHRLVRAYHRLLCWDIERSPVVTRLAERLLAPVIGKSLVIYARKPASAGPTRPRSTVHATA